MASISSVAGKAPGTTPISPAKNSNIRNISILIGDINTEVSQALTSNVKKFMLQSRELTILRVADTAGEVNTGPYITLTGKEHNVIWDGLDFSGTIFLRSTRPTVIEIWEWF